MSAKPHETDGRFPFADLSALLAGSRLALFLAGILGAGLLASGLGVQKGNLVYHDPAPVWIDIWARWDSEWYLLIADQGYDAHRFFDHLPRYEPTATAGFFPLYPWIIRALSPLFGGILSGILISNLCLAVSCVLLYRLTAAECDEGHARHAGLAACAALLVYPASLFLSAVYAESLHLMLSLATFERARRGRFAAAAACAFLAGITRPAGVLLAIPLAVEWWARRRNRAVRWGWIAPIAPAAGIGAYMMFCWRTFGDPLAFLHRQERWRGAMSGPWRAFTRWWETTPALHGAHDSTVEMATACFFLAMLPVLFRRLPRAYALYAAAVVLLPLTTTLWSFGRLAIGAFPVFMVIGMARTSTGRHLAAIYRLAGAALGGVWMALFASWWWVG